MKDSNDLAEGQLNSAEKTIAPLYALLCVMPNKPTTTMVLNIAEAGGLNKQHRPLSSRIAYYQRAYN